jgi:hypothetical protein
VTGLDLFLAGLLLVGLAVAAVLAVLGGGDPR